MGAGGEGSGIVGPPALSGIPAVGRIFRRACSEAVGDSLSVTFHKGLLKNDLNKCRSDSVAWRPGCYLPRRQRAFFPKSPTRCVLPSVLKSGLARPIRTRVSPGVPPHVSRADVSPGTGGVERPRGSRVAHGASPKASPVAPRPRALRPSPNPPRPLDPFPKAAHLFSRLPHTRKSVPRLGSNGQ